MRRKRAGFTLMEITLVMALMLIMLTLAVTSMEGMGGEVKTRAAADAFRAALVTARKHAIDEGRTYRVSVKPGTGHYRVAPDGESFWTGSLDSGSTTDGTPALVQAGTLPGDIRFASENGEQEDANSVQPDLDSVDWSQAFRQATFRPDGSALNDMTTTFHIAGSRPLVLRLRALTGGVTVGPAESEGGQP